MKNWPAVQELVEPLASVRVQQLIGSFLLSLPATLVAEGTTLLAGGRHGG